jgi:hypothetical protein
MIGSPTNFQHTGHIGSGDVDTGNSRLRAIQNQMQSKGGYETAFSTVQVKHGFVWYDQWEELLENDYLEDQEGDGWRILRLMLWKWDG